MSDRKTSIPTNSEIIEDLTKDLASSQFVVSQEQKEQSANFLPSSTDLEPPDHNHEDSDEEKPENEVVEDDFVDEEHLKDLELQLTTEEKLVRRTKALELKASGNSEFSQQKYSEAVFSYTEALRSCPLEFSKDRAVLYGNRAAAKLNLERSKSAIDDCSKALEIDGDYVKVYFRRARLYEQTDKLDESLEDYKKILELDPGNKEALMACQRLPPLINERNEKLKTEMFGKLKDLGNMILNPFGLSTENFQVQQDPNSGGYSVNFQQNAPRS